MERYIVADKDEKLSRCIGPYSSQWEAEKSLEMIESRIAQGGRTKLKNFRIVTEEELAEISKKVYVVNDTEELRQSLSKRMRRNDPGE